MYPSWLLEPPLKLPAGDDHAPHYQGDPLRLLAGPQRVETGWWDVRPGTAGTGGPTPVLRDYFIAHSAQAGLLWIYCRRPLSRQLDEKAKAKDWYLHGVFG